MRIGMAQINCTLGDFAGNREKIVRYAKTALEQTCDLVLFPELTLFGYVPQDLLERPSIVGEQLREFAKLQNEIPAGIAIVVGVVTINPSPLKTGKGGKPFFNTAALLVKGKKPKFFHKQLLPTYDVFDEARHMEPGRIADNGFTFKGQKILMTICEDIWGWELPEHPSNYMINPLTPLKKNKYDLILNISASPYTNEKRRDRRHVVEKTAAHFKAPIVYVNLVGGQDEIIFDGGSLAVDAHGRELAHCPSFVENFNVLDLDEMAGKKHPHIRNEMEELRQALVLGIRDYVAKSGFKKVHVGLSGGIDSALVACLAVDAVGPENVTAVTMPSKFNESRSKSLAEELARNLGIRAIDIPIQKPFEALDAALQAALGPIEFGLVQENLQARTRGALLMALSNQENSLLLATSNKSEFATGYSTLYGDMCGGLAPIGDLVKTHVIALCEHYNREHELIPSEIITRPPSAELRPNQKDQDSLPPYKELDKAVRNLVDLQKPARSATEKWLLPRLMKSEFKRWQAAPILKVTAHAFGRGRRMPLAHKATD